MDALSVASPDKFRLVMLRPLVEALPTVKAPLTSSSLPEITAVVLGLADDALLPMFSAPLTVRIFPAPIVSVSVGVFVRLRMFNAEVVTLPFSVRLSPLLLSEPSVIALEAVMLKLMTCVLPLALLTTNGPESARSLPLSANADAPVLKLSEANVVPAVKSLNTDVTFDVAKKSASPALACAASSRARSTGCCRAPLARSCWRLWRCPRYRRRPPWP